MNRYIKALAVVLVCLMLTGCIVGFAHYDVENGRWAFIHWNEGVGRSVAYIEGADLSTFIAIDSFHAKDKNSVYDRSKVVPNADPKTFRHLVGDYWRDAHSVFLDGGAMLEGADPESFHPLAIAPWAADAAHIFFYYFRAPIEDPSSFVLINKDWAKDAHHYYSPAIRDYIVNCDYGSLVFLNAAYAKDKERVFWCGQEIKGADFASFEVWNDQTAHDKFRRYRGSSEFWEDENARKEKQPPTR